MTQSITAGTTGTNRRQNLYDSNSAMVRERSINDSIAIDKNGYFTESGKVAQKELLSQYKLDIISVILNDSFENGMISQSENYILSNSSPSQVENIKNAAMELYLEYIDNSQVLTGLLIMMGSLPFEVAGPQGQVMALGLLQHSDYGVRDRAIQAFERWNSKQGIPILQALKCDKAWLQRYVDKVVAYLKEGGEE